MGRRAMGRTSWWVMGLCLLAGCQATMVSTVWKTPEALPPPFAKVAVFIAGSSPAERRAGEEELVRLLGPGRGVAGYAFVGDEELKDREKIVNAIRSRGIDGVIVVRLVAADKRTTYVPPSYESSYTPEGYYGGFVSPRPPTSTPGYSVTDTVYRAEISIYSVRDQRLLWAGASETTNPANVKDWVRQVVKASKAELKKQGMLQ